jgi:UDP-N-acetylenolpyruvoylglucosamine reductase
LTVVQVHGQFIINTGAAPTKAIIALRLSLAKPRIARPSDTRLKRKRVRFRSVIDAATFANGTL